MQTKIHINLVEGIVDVEGDPGLVREVYSDFKERLLSESVRSSASAEPAADIRTSTRKQPVKQRSSPKTESGKAGSAVPNPAIPRLDKNLDLSALKDFYAQFRAKNHPERVLLFLWFLTETLSIEAPNTDQVYSCYEAVDERIPRAFTQAFHDASGRSYGYIDFNSPTDIKITTVGRNHFKFNIKTKTTE